MVTLMGFIPDSIEKLALIEADQRASSAGRADD
jgi:hypothetical protein